MATQKRGTTATTKRKTAGTATGGKMAKKIGRPAATGKTAAKPRAKRAAG